MPAAGRHPEIQRRSVVKAASPARGTTVFLHARIQRKSLEMVGVVSGKALTGHLQC